MPVKTREVATQWYTVNGLLKKNTEIMILTNFRNVTTRVTESDENSVVRTNTLLMHTN